MAAFIAGAPVVAGDRELINPNTSGRDGGGVLRRNCGIDWPAAMRSARNKRCATAAAYPRCSSALAAPVSAVQRWSPLLAPITPLSAAAPYAADGARVDIQNIEVVDNSAQDGGAILMRAAAAASTMI